jgi:hypothetical protein
MHNITNRTPPVLSLGRVLITPAAAQAIVDSSQGFSDFVARYVKGDWGDCSDEDWEHNNRALETRDRVLGIYHTAKGQKIWIITDQGNDTTTILMPAEY